MLPPHSYSCMSIGLNMMPKANFPLNIPPGKNESIVLTQTAQTMP
ncbi:hypothetical protein S1OALGB6SA_2092 [Olavius algarvensis spirochete endosymbiont]|nr:MAG: hypothetical protein [Olavius algarvensis spirochete endosymbiont]VDB00998.1 hypothetical protein S1OALGB6SA_2092 [Olavius algarvensis spirochete endosymbiont]